MTTAFDHPSHREAEELSYRALRLMRAEQWDEARELYAQAGFGELVVARTLDPRHAANEAVAAYQRKLRSIFAISAAACLVKAQRWNEAARVAHEFLALPELLLPDSALELDDLLEQARRSREVADVLKSGDLAPLEIRLEGGQIRRGVAPTKLTQPRGEVTEATLMRIVDWRAGRKFRLRGSSVFAANLQIYEAPARAASYGIRLFIGAVSPQTEVPGTSASCTPHAVVETFLDLAERVEDGLAAVSEYVQDKLYARSFVRAFRDLAPDGVRLSNVTFSPGGSAAGRSAISLDSATRARLTKELATTEPGLVEVSGILKAVSLRRHNRRIVVETGVDAIQEFQLRKGEHDDTIGPMLNRRVQVVGKQVRKRIVAVDVDLIEE